MTALHVGLRGDARLIMVKNKDATPFFNQAENRYGNVLRAHETAKTGTRPVTPRAYQVQVGVSFQEKAFR
jgi:hypothetical protein